MTELASRPIDQAVEAIQAGKPVILPTDTVYGLCASPFREQYIRALYRLKDRPENQPLGLIFGDLEMLLECIPELRGRSATIARALLPGPYTLVFPNPGRRYRWLTGDRPDTIGVRVPVLPDGARDVLDRVGATAATSANRSGGLDPARLDDIPDEIRSQCGAEIDAGTLPGVPSTVLDLTGAEPSVVREGAVPAADALARVDEALA